MRDKWGTGSGWVWTESLVDESARELDYEAMRQEENLLGDFLRLADDMPNQRVQEIREVLAPLFDDPRGSPACHQSLGYGYSTVGQIGKKSLVVDRLMTSEE